MSGIVLADEFRAYCREAGVGSRDRVAESVASYVAYLERLSRVAWEEMNPETLRSEEDVKRLSEKLECARVNQRSVSNIKRAMRRYVGMVEAYAPK